MNQTHKPDPNTLCRTCRHFFVTYQRAMPNACRVFNIKTKTLPCVQVQRESGSPCHAWEPKAGAAPTRGA